MRKYQEVARTVFLTSGDQKRKLHVELQDKVTGLYTNIRLFQKGLEKLPGMLMLFKVLYTHIPVNFLGKFLNTPEILLEKA